MLSHSSFSAKTFWRFFVLSFATALLSTIYTACNKKESAANPEEAKLLAGKRIYANNCTACHSADPHKDGSLGPAIAGSSLELVTARITLASYPDGYKPKRDTHIMPRLPLTVEDINNVVAFLNSKP